jgi:hypothetical protein
MAAGMGTMGAAPMQSRSTRPDYSDEDGYPVDLGDDGKPYTRPTVDTPGDFIKGGVVFVVFVVVAVVAHEVLVALGLWTGP